MMLNMLILTQVVVDPVTEGHLLLIEHHVLGSHLTCDHLSILVMLSARLECLGHILTLKIVTKLYECHLLNDVFSSNVTRLLHTQGEFSHFVFRKSDPDTVQ